MTAPKNRPNAIKRRLIHIESKLKHYRAELEKLQKQCKHPKATKEHKGDTGNWCPQDDRYWTEFRCPDCGNFWTEDGSK